MLRHRMLLRGAAGVPGRASSVGYSSISLVIGAAPLQLVSNETIKSASPRQAREARTMNAQPNLGMQVTTFENPMGIDGFEFVEFAAPEGQGELLHDYFRKMGFTAVHAPQDAADHRLSPGRGQLPGQRGSRIPSPPISPGRTAPAPAASRSASRSRRDEVLQAVLGNGGEAIDHKADSKAVDAPVVKGIGDCMLYLVDRYGDEGFDLRGLRADAGRRPAPEGLRPDLHRPPHPQPLLRQHAEVVGLLRAPVQLPRDPLLRHQGRQDRPGVQGDDRARRHGAHPAQRIQRPEVADQRIPGRLQGRRHPAHRLLHRRHLFDRGSDARAGRGIPGHARHVFRSDRPARARTTARTCRAWRRTRS